MMANEVMTNEQKCIALISKLNEKVLATVLLFLEGLVDQERHLKETPAERVQGIEEQIEKREREKKVKWEYEYREREENFRQAQNELQQWIDKKSKGVNIPERYDIGSKDMETIICGVDAIKYDLLVGKYDILWDIISALYDYGFKRGCNYIKNKKKATATPTK